MLSTGVDRFADDIASMIGFRPGIYWRICWKFIAPCFLLVKTVVARGVPKGDIKDLYAPELPCTVHQWDSAASATKFS